MDLEGRHRNWAQAQAKHDWILSLDADERVMPELTAEIRELFAGQPKFETYAIPRRNFIGAQWIRHGGWYPSAQLKMFKRSVFRWEETTVHPRAICDRACGTLRHDLLHYSYQSPEEFIRKMDRQTTLEAQKWVLDGRRVTLGKALWRTFDRALRSYVLKHGYRDGRLGWFVARMAGTYQWWSYAKYRRAKQAQGVKQTGGPAGGAPATDTTAASAPTTAGS
jgi:hypothetical protein